LGCANSEAEILYTLDGTDPKHNGNIYKAPINISDNVTLKAVAKYENNYSKSISTDFVLIPDEYKLIVNKKYENQYSAGGDNALIDGMRGGKSFKTGLWQGYQHNFDVVIDLGKESSINKVSIGFLQDLAAWIVMPKKVSFYISDDGLKYRKIGEEKNKISIREEKSIVYDFSVTKHIKARYLKVTADNFGVLPEWHLGKGGDAWLFTDEIIIE